MSGQFAAIVEDVKQLNADEKKELHDLIEKYLIEERRSEIQANYTESLKEFEAGQYEFTSNMDELKRKLLND